ncbi:MAG: 16S rRNA (guanine(527)-N(7))-methyltransferase RsmG [Clostridia bacterium]|nr:16S rRNA (guanine(527)-N(7))-methyltransferase RsmG [Clostridia bacterium]
MTDFERKLIEVANKNEATRGLINEKQASLLSKISEHMIEVNKALNLTAIKDEDGIILKHLVDSSACVNFIPQNASICDIGCGGGFPSLVIASLRDDVKILSVDSVTKKVKYVEDTARLFSLDNISVSSERAETLGQDSLYREKFDVATARAVGRLNLICELCLPLVKVGGAFVAMKAQSTDEEINEAINAIELLGAKIEDVKKYTLTNGSEEIERSIIIIRKVKSTPLKYPRNNSQIAKKPL